MIVKKLSEKKIQVIDKVPIICWTKEEDYRYLFPHQIDYTKYPWVKIDEVEVKLNYKYHIDYYNNIDYYNLINRNHNFLNIISKKFGIKKKFIYFCWENEDFLFNSSLISVGDFKINNKVVAIRFTDNNWYKVWSRDNKINLILNENF